MKHLTALEDFMQRLDWRGKWLMGGDWNECWDESWISTLALLQGGIVQDLELIPSSRWDSSRTIDYWISNFSVEPGFRRWEKVSDHCIITTAVRFGSKADEKHLRFVQHRQFSCPEWLEQDVWDQLFGQAWSHGLDEAWLTPIEWVENLKWQPDADEQQIVDYHWSVVCAKLTWCFSVASGYAINYIPVEYDNHAEVERVVANANTTKIKGVNIKLQERTLQLRKEKGSEAKRRIYKKAGRLEDLIRRLRKGDHSSMTTNLMKKLFPDQLSTEIPINMVEKELESLEEWRVKSESKEKYANIQKWKKKMKTDPKARGEWINRKGALLSPMVADGKIAETKIEGVSMIHSYWKQFWEKQEAMAFDRADRVSALSQFMDEKMAGYTGSCSRPTLEEFREGLRRISGTHGVDGWSSNELKTISHHGLAAAMIWCAMELWEEEQVIPSPILHGKMVCIPKRDERLLSPQQFRPIGVLSSLWRAWSSTWIRTRCIREWMENFFPPEAGGGIPGSTGPEVMASYIDHELEEAKFGSSLDLKHAFDTVDMAMTKQSFGKHFVGPMGNWFELLHLQWTSMRRWVIYEGCVHGQALTPGHGLPQGDPAAPLLMNILIYACASMVKEICQDEDLRQVTYMDDRNLVSTSEEKIQAAEKAWADVATRFHLMENPSKAQRVHLGQQQSMEVLGAMVGKISPVARKTSKSTSRLNGAEAKYKRVAMLPLTINEKLKTANRHVLAGLDYGWVAADPIPSQFKSQEISLWKALGRTNYVSPHMRGVIFGAHSQLLLRILRRQIRILSKRNQLLNKMGKSVHASTLERLVTSKLVALGWTCQNGWWRHELCLDGFKIDEMNDDNKWLKASHCLRESYRQNRFEMLRNCGRHDAQCIDVPYPSHRRKLAIEWIGENFIAFMLVCGGIASPYQRANFGGGRYHQRCPTCGTDNPGWGHLWQCFTGSIPEDGLLYRFLWPRDKKDYVQCNAFLRGMQLMTC